MALEPISRNFHSAAARLRHAAYIGATVGLMTLSNFAAAEEQTVGIGPAPAATTTEAPNEFEPISKRECTIIFATSSKLVGDIVKGKDTEPAFKKEPWDPIFAEGLARFIAPAKVAPVYKIIVDGSFDKFSHPKTPKDLAFARDVLQEVNCEGPKNIPTPDGLAVVAAGSIARALVAAKDPIVIGAKGVRFVNPAEVAVNIPRSPGIPAVLGPRTELLAPPVR